MLLFIGGISITIIKMNEDPKLSQKEKITDFNYMYTILEENYPYFELNKRLYNVDWLSNKEKYLNDVKKTKNDNEFFNVLHNILMDLHNGHTGVLNVNRYYMFKNILKTSYSFNELYKVLNGDKAVQRYENSKKASKNNNLDSTANNNGLIKNNLTQEIIEKDKIAYMGIKMFNILNMQEDSKSINEFLNSVKNYETLIIDIRGNGGGGENYWKDYIVPLLINKPVQCNNYLLFRGGDYSDKFIKSRFNDNSLIPINNITNENLSNMPPETLSTFKTYVKNTYTISPNNSINFKGKIYLLVDGDVYSSSEAFAVFSKSTNFATLVGEKTGGDGIGIDVALCMLPNSGFVFVYAQTMGLTYNGTCNEEYKTEPDIKVSAKRGDNLLNDEAIKKVLQLSND
jgi:hypothetical protein